MVCIQCSAVVVVEIMQVVYPTGDYFKTKKGKVLPYSLPCVGPGADSGVQALSPQVT